MVGTLLNTAAILVGGGIGLTAKKQISPATQHFLKVGMGVFTIFVGFKISITSLHGSFGHVMGQIGIVFLSLILGRLLGRLLHLQKASNRAGQYAKELMAKSGGATDQRFSDGFITCSLLFCVGPMAILGSIQDGTRGDFSTLAIKAMMDG